MTKNDKEIKVLYKTAWIAYNSTGIYISIKV